jgi:D-amino-acid oxidase
MSTPEVLVIGAGVSGLTTALRIAREGHTVRVRTDRDPSATTSAVAGAIWGLVTVDDPRVLSWALETWHELSRIAANHPESGVHMLEGVEAACDSTATPEWVAGVGGHEAVPVEDVPKGYAAAWRYRVPGVEMPLYLRFLAAQLSALDVAIEQAAPLRSLDETADQAHLVVNCTGLGSRELVDDDEMYTVEGQLVVVDNPGIESFFVDDAEPPEREPTYYVAHKDHVVLGGSWDPDGDGTTPDPHVARGIIARCAAIEPALADARVREHRVGLRPARSHVRIEREDRPSGPVIHNYGHGGNGLSLSWGCAREVVQTLNSRID